ncbi:hypothetical protein [Mucilaginibacter sp. SG564]|uniref:hypothetical protein n=1 Tax=Mucilaginibacter sp. SG564 TaxID=2587022 RepID=UPI0015534418|nr:hypothetical protein [Mucilaginibacter sp. SG564]NOW93842.1 hypothetical protein [Mucilaginibacter sp. SG564]
MNTCVKKCIFLLISLLYSLASFGQIKEDTALIKPELIEKDSLFVKRLAHVYKNAPASILPLFNAVNRKSNDLGFNYYSVRGIYEIGYLSIRYHFIFFKDKLISYELSSLLPFDSRLTNRYREICSLLFEPGNGYFTKPVYYKYDEMVKPLNTNTKQYTTDKKIQFLMTPYSGEIYGVYAFMGYSPILLENRRNYNAIKDKITPEIELMLLYSKNPATRLSAIEYYYQHPEQFIKDKDRYEKRVKAIYAESPLIETVVADRPSTQNAEEMVKLFAAWH